MPSTARTVVDATSSAAGRAGSLAIGAPGRVYESGRRVGDEAGRRIRAATGAVRGDPPARPWPLIAGIAAGGFALGTVVGMALRSGWGRCEAVKKDERRAPEYDTAAEGTD